MLELVVVLTVLVALAGILLPTLPNLLQKSHVAVCSTNIPELNKAMLTYGTLQFQQPNQFDNLVDASGDLDGLPEGGVDCAGSLDVGNLTADEVDALNDVGITTIVIADWDENPTFGAHTTAPVVLDGTNDVLIASAAHVQDVLNVGTGADERFVVFGVGQQATAKTSISKRLKPKLSSILPWTNDDSLEPSEPAQIPPSKRIEHLSISPETRFTSPMTNTCRRAGCGTERSGDGQPNGCPAGVSVANQICTSGSTRGEWQEGLASQVPPVTLYSTGSNSCEWAGVSGGSRRAREGCGGRCLARCRRWRGRRF
ncbi:MAG: hypothetical protein EA353_04945 [Puniceicoccaceae bacterium]|nr:MAG: hypothetical protein EA353_04945 [Puniceicoccaceae bacterium]